MKSKILIGILFVVSACSTLEKNDLGKSKRNPSAEQPGQEWHQKERSLKIGNAIGKLIETELPGQRMGAALSIEICLLDNVTNQPVRRTPIAVEDLTQKDPGQTRQSLKTDKDGCLSWQSSQDREESENTSKVFSVFRDNSEKQLHVGFVVNRRPSQEVVVLSEN